ncbi:VacJ family lipoprotein [Ectothiorhodospira sp. BSL-9]|uniref:MlaA family lipoprotein n=1 Tax=Ectothiorhodospira sp. BSL-9 TaxID=1442136 RepID=UPI0007B43D92|nr:VacJ family lipoprotein [Ectothiorhodospira sp. BSL-9]ANB02701.1 ABC transporter [Ectothiorhodospira sp. BSL-9]
MGGILTVLLACAFLITGCATVPPESQDPRDPWESYNRAMFQFNDAVDRAVLKPVAQGYDKVTPQPVRTGIGNFFSNLGDVHNMANNALQFKFHDAASDLTRLIMNTSFGVFGLFDVATPMGLEKSNEDFGQTLGSWGVPSGPYFVVPFRGPSTVRDAPAEIVDARIHPLYYHDDVAQRNVLVGLRLVDIRAGLLPTERALEGMAMDRYMAIRNAYLDRREYLVTDGAPSDAQRDLLRELEDWDDDF